MKSHLTLTNLPLPLFVGLITLVEGCSFFGDGVPEGYLVTPPTQVFGATLNSQASEHHPRLSYDGRYLVFVSDRHSQRTIFLYDQHRRKLIDLPGLNHIGVIQEQPDISADGRYIVYLSEQFGKPDVFVYDRQTLKSQAVTKNLFAEVRHPTISGDGHFISFEVNRNGQWDIAIYDRGSGVELSLPDAISQTP